MLRVTITQSRMGFNGATLTQIPHTQKVHILQNVSIGDALIQNWRNETKQYRDEVVQGRFLGDEWILASGKAYEMSIKAVPTGFQLWA
ncbi:hypothetical protein G4923_09175 [Aeromonas rivipollensis]|uniref:Uncharacterized protein n=1 Tax=Aeromonas rivipollensis TaxID=948519 RepID=A0ABX0D2Y4_9GAMM|nr:hypothetical protein [Aeromonas rivipollensis]NEX88874.1 hypothetical protein [Aeromonas rivipollensis]NEY06978.1 hypothetical protein [Aeromonas rivipollensis]